MKDISQNSKKVMVVFLFCFISLITYIMYLYVGSGEKIVSSVYNNRLWLERKTTVRGSIFDRNKKVLIESKGIKDNDQKLNYLGGEAFAHVLGYMDPLYGLTGLQNIYDKQLMGKIDGVFNPSDSKGLKRGYNLFTTIDYELQSKAYELLGDNKGAVVALNPKTGEILAMVSKPSYNPNNLRENWKSLNSAKNSPLLNRATSGMYPPGSTFKIITATSALENISGVKNRTFQDKGVLKFNGKDSLRNYKGEVLGNIDFKGAFTHSSNVFFATLGLELGNDKLKATAEKFCFNKNIEANGTIIENSRFPKYEAYEKGNIAQSAIGQSSVLATPMEMALVASTVANNGIMMKPNLVLQIKNSKDKVLSSFEPKSLGEITSSANAEIIKNYMREVVKSGTGKGAAVEGISVCGKTGTAEHHDKSEDENNPHSWFVGFAPYEEPKIAFAVIVEEGGTGGGKAAKISRELIKNYLNR